MTVNAKEITCLSDDDLLKKRTEGKYNSETTIAAREEIATRNILKQTKAAKSLQEAAESQKKAANSQEEAARSAVTTACWTKWMAIGTFAMAAVTFASLMYQIFSTGSTTVNQQSASAADTTNRHSIADYLSDGYRIVSKSEQLRLLPGTPPYESLPRRVLVTTYALERAAKRVICVQTYDSQRETLGSACR